MHSKSLVEVTAELMAAIVAAQRAPEEDVVALYKRLYQAVRESHQDEAKLRADLTDAAPVRASAPAMPGFPSIPGLPPFPFPFPGFPGMPTLGADGKPLGT